MLKDYINLKNYINQNPEVHSWVKEVANKLENLDPDPVDALNGCQLLAELYKAKLHF